MPQSHCDQRYLFNYVQVVWAGEGSGKMIEYIVSQSSIIQAYRKCIDEIEDDFCVPEKTLCHASPDIGSCLEKIQQDL